MAPEALESILAQSKPAQHDRLVVGHHTNDDAAVYDLGNGQGLISTTDFFMPIVDDPFTFGRIAAANAVSDVYAMGGRPVLGIGILGWPAGKIPYSAAREVMEGARALAEEAGFPIGGGHSIDNPEPIFGLAVNGLVDLKQLKRNNTAQPGDLLYLTKGLGIGLLTTAEKKGVLRPQDEGVAARIMTALNSVGLELGRLEAVTAMTDVTGFGLLGHALEICRGSGVSAEIEESKVPHAVDLAYYLENKCSPGGTGRNFESYGKYLGPLTEDQKAVLCDPQTSGGLLVAVRPGKVSEVETVLQEAGLDAFAHPIGRVLPENSDGPVVAVIP